MRISDTIVAKFLFRTHRTTLGGGITTRQLARPMQLVQPMRLRIPTLVLLTSTSLVAACSGGERNQTGDCPADEVCSDQTPDGLHFLGTELHDLPVGTGPFSTAVGGTQFVDIMIKDQGDQLVPLADRFPFAASISDGDALTVQPGGVGGSNVLVTGLAAGTDYLRITEPNSELLMDRISLTAGSIERVDLVAPGLEVRDSGAALAFLAGEIRFGLNLFGSGSARLIDTSLTASLGGSAATMLRFDVAQNLTASPGTTTVAIIAGGASFSKTIEVVAAIDIIAPQSDTFEDVISVGDQGSVCFAAKAGTAVVAGLAWTFDVAGAATQGESVYTNCAAITFNSEGTATVTASAGGSTVDTLLSTGATLRARPGAGKVKTLLSTPPARTTAGERAGSAQ